MLGSYQKSGTTRPAPLPPRSSVLLMRIAILVGRRLRRIACCRRPPRHNCDDRLPRKQL